MQTGPGNQTPSIPRHSLVACLPWQVASWARATRKVSASVRLQPKKPDRVTSDNGAPSSRGLVKRAGTERQLTEMLGFSAMSGAADSGSARDDDGGAATGDSAQEMKMLMPKRAVTQA